MIENALSLSFLDKVVIATDTHQLDEYINKYIETLKNLSKAGIEVVCYNFMPVFDWLRTDLNKKLTDGSYTMAYEVFVVSSINLHISLDL